jgi:glycosyltransferase involved in cell wall biosynthesis
MNNADSPAGVELTVLMPCLDEAETLATCIDKARECMARDGIDGEVLVADNGSKDGSREIATQHGARVVEVETRGYGAALSCGIQAARGKYIIMGDADDSYDFANLLPFLEQLRGGAQLVMGNRFRGGIRPGAMPFLHRYLGNPVLSTIGRICFPSSVGDFHCGLRGFEKTAIQRLQLQTTGMEFASEMVVKATLNGLRICEVPTTLSPDGRTRSPHLRTWRDGWRHLRFLLLYSPRWLFIYPGIALILLGLGTGIWLMAGSRVIGDITFDVHTMVFAAFFVLLGYQSLFFGVFTKVFAISEGLLPEDPRLRRFLKFFSLELGLLVGTLLTIAGLLGSTVAVGIWYSVSFGDLEPTDMLRIVIPSGTALTLGVQTILSSFFLSVLELRRKPSTVRS